MTTSIRGVGTAVPPYSIAQQDAAIQTGDFCAFDKEQQQLLRYIYQQTGIQSRHSVTLQASTNGTPAKQNFYPTVPPHAAHDPQSSQRGPTTAERMALYETFAAPLAMTAAQRALQAADVSPEQITHLVTVSCSGFAAPGADLALIRDLPLRLDVQRTHVGFMGCHGALNGLRVAHAFAAADPSACVLLCAVELCTVHLQYGFTMQRVISNSLFADGAAALVCRGGAPVLGDWQLRAHGSVVMPDSADAMTWRIGDNGFEMTLSAQVPPLIQQHLRPWLEGWLRQHGLTIEQVGSWAVHPGGPKILLACCESLALDRSAVRVSEEVLQRYGNMSSPTILFILERLMAERAPGPVVALGFGPGLVVEAALFT